VKALMGYKICFVQAKVTIAVLHDEDCEALLSYVTR